jgi:phytanoyl-CoA hydroxylase
MDGTELHLDMSAGGGACGEWTEHDGVPTVAMTGQHTISRKHE